ncbi:ornithine carbamoyltransferase [Thioalkalivibrio sp. HK1]|uniref:ornithine carbamoyltransferase n=1 Tax=Thioalkalivibrio sp. HK1 TaxID=1469245 RepID=UPI00047193A4|nr:ornithine carbamoyltransferase [Thioalkalivibrio sp. HK1]
MSERTKPERIKHLLDWKFWSRQDIRALLDLALRIKQDRREFEDRLHARTLVMLFQKTSTRTRVSFEAGMTALGGHAIHLDWRASNFTLGDIRSEARYLSRNCAFIMARVRDHADVRSMTEVATVPVINGCCNLYHPCQALADVLTIAEDRGGDPSGARLVYIGVYNNVVNSLVSICEAFDIHLTLVCPLRDDSVIDQQSRRRLLDKGLLKESLDAKESLNGAHYVYTDTWLDMEFFNDPAYADEKERRISLMLPYQINSDLLAGSQAKVMHDMPMHLGYEITEEVANGERSIIYEQSENRLHAQNAILIDLS